MEKFRMATALKRAKEGRFEFVNDAREGINEVRYQSPSGKWKTKQIEISHTPSESPKVENQPAF